MYSTRVLELIQIFILYSVTIFGLGDIISRPFTREKGISYRIIVDLTVGNFYIINITFVLAFLEILKQPVILTVFLAGAVFLRYCFDKERMQIYWRHKYNIVESILKGEYGGWLAVKRGCTVLVTGITGRVKLLCCGRGMEFLLLIAAQVINVYYASYQALNVVSYSAPDVEVHLYWIQSLVGGNLFPAGVYPFGMHCVGAALSLMYDVSAVVIARMLGVVTTFYIMLVCYILVKSICRQKYAPVLGLILFLTVEFSVETTYIRYSSMIAQEYAMMFLCPIMVFLFRYLNNKNKQDLILFSIATSLTLAIHFYITAIACFFFLAVGLVYFVRMVRQKMLLPIITAGISSIIVAILPLLIGLALGYELEQSFAYGYAVLTNDYTAYSDEEDVEEIEAIEAPYGFLAETPYTWDNVKTVGSGLLRTYCFSDVNYIWLYIVSLAFVLLNWLVRILLKKNNDLAMEYLALAVYIGIVFFQTIASMFDFPVIIEPKRMAIFLMYMLPAMIAIPLDLIYVFFLEKRNIRRVWNVGILVLLGGSLLYAGKTNNFRPIPQTYYFQTTGAMKAACDIIKNYEDYSWTIVSAVNETSLVYNHGYHYEMIEFLQEQENYEEGMEIFIPTEYVFFYVEKMPITRYGYHFDIDESILSERERINKEDAIAPIESLYNGADDYYKYERMKLMSRMYYWVQEYSKYFPDEMSVFYEDEEIVIYRLKQNEYALNNLAIDYRGGLIDE